MLGRARRFVKEESRKKSSCARPGQPERLSLHGLGEDLIVDVWTLCRIAVSLPWFLHYLDIEVDRQGLRGEALGVVAGLVSQCPAHGIFSRHHRTQGMHCDLDSEIATVHAQLFVGRERK